MTVIRTQIILALLALLLTLGWAANDGLVGGVNAVDLSTLSSGATEALKELLKIVPALSKGTVTALKQQVVSGIKYIFTFTFEGGKTIDWDVWSHPWM